MAKTVEFNKKGIDYIVRRMAEPIDDASPYFNILALLVDRTTQQTFRLEGLRAGKPKWIGFNRGRGIGSKGYTTRTKLGTWNIRYGSDKNPKRSASELRAYKTDNNLWYKSGPMKGYKSDRRYSASSKLLQASGSFRKSFRLRSVSDNGMTYGTGYKDAEKIMSNPTRQVLFVANSDRQIWGKQFVNFYNRGLKF